MRILRTTGGTEIRGTNAYQGAQVTDCRSVRPRRPPRIRAPGRRRAGAFAEYECFGERIAGEAVGAVGPADRLARRAAPGERVLQVVPADARKRFPEQPGKVGGVDHGIEYPYDTPCMR